MRSCKSRLRRTKWRITQNPLDGTRISGEEDNSTTSEPGRALPNFYFALNTPLFILYPGPKRTKPTIPCNNIIKDRIPNPQITMDQSMPLPSYLPTPYRTSVIRPLFWGPPSVHYPRYFRQLTARPVSMYFPTIATSH